MSLRKYEGFQVLEGGGARSLFDRCPWRTVFAHPDFLAAWYRSRPDLTPILIAGRTGARLDALVPLASKDGALFFAGAGDVPVHGWLAEPLRGSFVLERYLAEVSGRFDRVSFAPPPGAPIDWLGEARVLGRRAWIQPVKRRVFRFDRERAKQKLDDKKNTSQLPQVKALGPLALEEARREELGIYLGWNEQKRHARGLQPGLQSARIDLYRRLEGSLLSATVLYAGSTALSAMLIYRDGPRAWLELLAENPEQERHSPGLLHLYLLEERWIDEVTELDVTADDDWMHRVAEDVDATEVEVLFRRSTRIRDRASRALRRFISRR